MAKPKIFVSWPGYSETDPETGARLVAAGYELILRPRTANRTAEELAGLLDGAVAAIASTDPFTAEVLASDPDLRVIARIGVGTDSIDQAAALRHGVGIAITPGLNAAPVADQTVAMILAMIRKVVVQDASTKAGRWERVGSFAPTEMPGKVVGLAGAGTIARAVMKRLAGFDTVLTYFDPHVAGVEGARRVETFDELLAQSDIVSLHVPLLPETRHLIDAAALARMKPTAYLVNTARGPLVDEPALFAALRAGQLAGAALDVFGTEPPDPAALAGVPNLVCSSHIAGLSHEAIRRMTISATSSVLAVLAGEIPDTVINPEALRRSTRG